MQTDKRSLSDLRRNYFIVSIIAFATFIVALYFVEVDVVTTDPMHVHSQSMTMMDILEEMLFSIDEELPHYLCILLIILGSASCVFPAFMTSPLLLCIFFVFCHNTPSYESMGFSLGQEVTNPEMMYVALMAFLVMTLVQTVVIGQVESEFKSTGRGTFSLIFFG